jgi:phosphatidylserine/phosphatidylglycerophosphate/cardiolipin synthase-like enzyme
MSMAAGVEVHYSPAERLDVIDAKLISAAKSSIDVAAYTLTSWMVIDALKTAEARGVAIRLVVDGREPLDAARLGPLLSAAGPLMHWKAYSVDGEVLRTGARPISAAPANKSRPTTLS